MIAKTMTSAAVVMAALFSSCGQEGVTDAGSPSFEQSVEISINGTEVYSETHLNPPEEMDEIMTKLINDLANKNFWYFYIELKYVLENAEEVLIDSYLGIFYENGYPRKPAKIGVTNYPNDDRVELMPLPVQRNIHIDVIREHYQRAFNDWWRREHIAKRGGADQPATAPGPKPEGDEKSKPQSEDRSR